MKKLLRLRKLSGWHKFSIYTNDSNLITIVPSHYTGKLVFRGWFYVEGTHPLSVPLNGCVYVLAADPMYHHIKIK